jgi:hypothetical protein
MVEPKSQIALSDENIISKIIQLKGLSPGAIAFREAFVNWDDEHKQIVAKEIKRIMRNFAFIKSFGIGAAVELLAFYVAHQNGWRDFTQTP